MLRTSFYTVAYHFEIAAWQQVALIAREAQRTRRTLRQLRPMLRPLARDALLSLCIGVCMGFVTTVVGIVLAPFVGA